MSGCLRALPAQGHEQSSPPSRHLKAPGTPAGRPRGARLTAESGPGVGLTSAVCGPRRPCGPSPSGAGVRACGPRGAFPPQWHPGSPRHSVALLASFRGPRLGPSRELQLVAGLRPAPHPGCRHSGYCGLCVVSGHPRWPRTHLALLRRPVSISSLTIHCGLALSIPRTPLPLDCRKFLKAFNFLKAVSEMHTIITTAPTSLSVARSVT